MESVTWVPIHNLKLQVSLGLKFIWQRYSQYRDKLLLSIDKLILRWCMFDQDRTPSREDVPHWCSSASVYSFRAECWVLFLVAILDEFHHFETLGKFLLATCVWTLLGTSREFLLEIPVVSGSFWQANLPSSLLNTWLIFCGVRSHCFWTFLRLVD